jgi:GNAT superfamily N-acetyltransferase
MLIEVTQAELPKLAHLFEGYPGLKGMVSAGLSGSMGSAFADDPSAPSVAILRLGTFEHLVGGALSERSLVETLEFLPPACFLVVPVSWAERLERDFAAFITPQKRIALSSPARWDRTRLESFVTALPEGFNLLPAGAENVDAFASLDRSLTANFDSATDFLARGAGFGIEYRGRFVSGCSSYALGGGKLELEIDTHPDFRRRGFASACGAALILYCLDRDIEPCWDAANEASADLAMKLGYVEPRPYTAYQLHPVVENAGNPPI